MKEGDFVLIDFVGRVKLTNDVFDLTDEETAKKEGIWSKEQKYGPAFVIIGAKMVVPGVEKRLKEMKVGEEREFEVSPKEGFGMRDPKLIRILNINNFYRNKINPVPGAYVNIDGKNARIQSVSGGRVRTDFNSPLAGKQLVYRLKIVERITDTKEKVKRIMDQYRIGFEEIIVENERVTIESGKELPEMLRKMVRELVLEWVKEVKKVEFKGKGKPAGSVPGRKPAGKE